MAVCPPGPVAAPIKHPRSSRLDDEIQYLKGVGPAGAGILGKMGIFTVGDLLKHVPRRYEDRTSYRRIRELRPGESATILGRVAAAENVGTTRKHFLLTKVLVDDGTGVVQIVFFQQPYLQRQFEELRRKGQMVVVYGQAKHSGFGALEMERVEWEELSLESDPLSTNRIVPVYPATEGITQRRLRRIVHTALENYLGAVEEVLPDSLIQAQTLIQRRAALAEIHFPSNWQLKDRARRRLVFEEFFLLQVGLCRRRAANATVEEGIRLHGSPDELAADLGAILPFELTGAQKRAIGEILADVTSGRAMNRLLQGDVGSGKTAIALAAMLLAERNGYQAALMAPTEILAQQHAQVFQHLLEPAGISVKLATGSLSAKGKKSVREGISAGDSAIVVGTHALIQEGVEFRKLGLVVIDEQHRFGVLQRQALHRKGERPHVLVMTATPIPRTLTMTIYGDLDTSIIDELPPGRKPIKTHWKRRAEAGSVYAAMQRLLNEGRQAYVVCPLVEESEKLQVKAATQLADHVQAELLPQFRVALLHGQMKAAEKDDVMLRFKAHEIDVLVATTVIEVGIDVPNASVMVIEDADRFGLAQLHQLRGRVGRGEHASFCVLIADAKTDDARARMQVMVDTQDGFRIAEEDLKLRGPGEFLGTKQSGLPDFYIGDLLNDAEIMQDARQAAFHLVESDPNLGKQTHEPLKRAVEASRFGFELIHVS